MFDPDSRYASIGTSVHVGSDGRAVTHVRRRFLPGPEDLTIVGGVTVRQEDRLDLISQRVYGDALAAWRLADANRAMHPVDLLTTGRSLRIALPES